MHMRLPRMPLGGPVDLLESSEGLRESRINKNPSKGKRKSQIQAKSTRNPAKSNRNRIEIKPNQNQNQIKSKSNQNQIKS